MYLYIQVLRLFFKLSIRSQFNKAALLFMEPLFLFLIHFGKVFHSYSLDQFIIPNVGTLTDWERLIHEWVGYVMYALMGYV